MEEFKQEFINVAYSEFGIKAIESINFEQAFAILDKMQALRIHDVVGRSEQLCPRCKSPLIYKRVHTDGYSCNNCFHDWA
jgi:tRNA(Ile2) C34 agmatinyltransferase TiaS